MKNSSKYLLAAVLVLLASITAYNMALRTEYRKGDYKNPLRGYVSQPFKDFTEVAVPAGNAVSVKLVPGPFSVRLHPRAAEYVHLSQQGGRLVITAIFPERQQFFGRAETVIISCPRLTALSTDAVDEIGGKQQINKHYGGSQTVRVQGFAQDSLVLRQDRGSRVELIGNKLGYLRATTGTTPGSHPWLQVSADNHIAAADLTLGHQSELTLSNVVIPKLRYHAADSAQVTLTGAALGSLPK
jgi:hypothetical protein